MVERRRPLVQSNNFTMSFKQSNIVYLYPVHFGEKIKGNSMPEKREKLAVMESLKERLRKVFGLYLYREDTIFSLTDM